MASSGPSRNSSRICISRMHILYTYAMRILLTEGAGLTSRQVATRLDHLGHDVSAAVSDPMCLARFTRHVHTLLRVPNFGDDASGLVRSRARRRHQVAHRRHLSDPGTGDGALAPASPPRSVPAWSPRCRPSPPWYRCRTRSRAVRTLDRLAVPQPRTLVVQNAAEAADWTSFPAYVKAPVGTGSTGVRRVGDASAVWTTRCAISSPPGRGRMGACWCRRR